MRSFASSIFRFLASLKLAIFLLIALAVLFTLGTFLESATSTETAQILVYRSPFLIFLLLLLTFNLAAAALDRLPWKQKHVGFVVTHLGIILMLVGSLLTQIYGIDGQMAIQEGGASNRILLSEPILQLVTPHSRQEATVSLPAHAFPWEGRKKLHDDPDLWLLRYYPKADRQVQVEASSEGSPALQITLESSMAHLKEWLFLDDPERNSMNLGPAELRFSREPMAPLEKTPEKAKEENRLEFHFKDQTIKVALPDKFPKTLPLSGTPYKATLLRVLRDAVVDNQNELVDQSEHWNNPAVQLMLEGEGVQEKHTVFSKYPDFPTMHGMKPSATGVRIAFRLAGEAAAAPPKNELRFIWSEPSSEAASPLRYQIRSGEKITEGKVSVGEPIETGWMDFRFKVENDYPHAQEKIIFNPEPLSSKSDSHHSAVQLEIEKEGETKSFWLGQGDSEELILGGEPLAVVYGLRNLPVGFRVELKDFRLVPYPGTSRPASFESDVVLKDDSTGTVRDFNIHMNHPLVHRGFRIFQSGYQQPEGEPEISIFTVAKDPGIWLKYLGAIILVLGTLIMFYSRRFSRRPGTGK